MATPTQIEQLLNGPALAPPSGVVPNFVDPPNHYATWVVTTVLCVFVSTVALAMRLFTKLRLLRDFGAEDYASLLGYLMWIGYIVPTVRIMMLGGGIHQWNVQLKNFISVLYYSNVAAIMYGITVFIIKLSVLLQYKKIFCPLNMRTYMWWGVHITICVNFVYYAAITFTEIFLCHPRDKYWNVFVQGGHCGSANAANISAGAVNALSDFVILLLPQGVIWRLKVPTRRKLEVSAIFLTGLFVCTTSVLRLYYAVRLAATGDVTNNVAYMGFWTYAELSVGVMCSCLPVAPKFLQYVGQKLSTVRVSAGALKTPTTRHSDQSAGVQQRQDSDRAWAKIEQVHSAPDIEMQPKVQLQSRAYVV